jgi:hypothetical protein
MQILDWGLMELSRKAGWDPAPAKSKMEDIATSGRFDFRLFLGNTMRWQKSFLIVALWYPKLDSSERRKQLGLF